jgi:glycosyltransferase involved in cell wall biosynthesis
MKASSLDSDPCATQSGTFTNHANGSRKPLLSIILPAYNEAETIRKVVIDYYREIVTKLPSNLVVAEDGSTDKTPQILVSIANEIPISVMSDRRRKGYAKGVCDALKSCSGEWIFFSDSDGQYSPSDFWRLWMNRYEYDMVIGRKVRRSEGISRVILSKFFHVLANNLFGLRLGDGDCGFRLIRKSVVEAVADKTRILEYSFWIEFTIRACLMGFRINEVPINHAVRANGGTRIYSSKKIPLIILKQLKGLSELFADVRRNK